MKALPAPSFHGLGKLFVKKLYGVLDRGVLVHHVLNRLAGMNDGTVITSSESISYFLQGMLGEDAGKVHSDLTGKSNVCRPPSRKHVCHSKVVVVHDLLLNRLNRDATEVFFPQNVAEQPLDGIKIGFFTSQANVTRHTSEGSFHAANVASYVFGEELNDFRLDGNPHGFCLFGKDGYSRLQIRGLYIGNQAPLKPRKQPAFDLVDFTGGSIAGQENLSLRIVDVIKSMEKLFLYALFPCEKLNVVNKKVVDASVPRAKFGQGVLLNGTNEFVGKFLTRNISNPTRRITVQSLMRDGMHKVSFA